MKLLKSAHYTITRLLLQDSDGKIYELCEDSLGNYYFYDWSKKEDEKDLKEHIDNWDEYSKSDFEDGQAFFGSDCSRLE